MKKVFVTVALSLLTVSCFGMGLRNKETKETVGEQARAAANNSHAIDSVIKGQPSPPVAVSQSGTNNTLDINVIPSDAYSANVNAQSDSSLDASEKSSKSESSSVRMPIGVAIAIGCFGLTMLIVAWILFSKLTAAGKAADIAVANVATQADRAFSVVCGLIESQLQTSTSDTDNAKLASILNAVNKERGKLNR